MENQELFLCESLKHNIDLIRNDEDARGWTMEQIATGLCGIAEAIKELDGSALRTEANLRMAREAICDYHFLLQLISQTKEPDWQAKC